MEGRSPAALSLSYVVMLIEGLSNHIKGGVLRILQTEIMSNARQKDFYYSTRDRICFLMSCFSITYLVPGKLWHPLWFLRENVLQTFFKSFRKNKGKNKLWLSPATRQRYDNINRKIESKEKGHIIFMTLLVSRHLNIINRYVCYGKTDTPWQRD